MMEACYLSISSCSTNFPSLEGALHVQKCFFYRGDTTHVQSPICRSFSTKLVMPFSGPWQSIRGNIVRRSLVVSSARPKHCIYSQYSNLHAQRQRVTCCLVLSISSYRTSNDATFSFTSSYPLEIETIFILHMNSHLSFIHIA